MNAYTDYDEGTYLLIARLINHGYLPYRDIYAVHPPLYYYALALWLRIFGDSYVIGRLFSVCIGYVSILVAYLVGRELLSETLGVLFSLLLALDPLLVYMNSWAYQETLIELFTLLSLYYFVKYLKQSSLRWGYISLFIAALGTTVKFTLIPYLVALYLTILLSEVRDAKQKVISAIDVLLSVKSLVALIATYIFWSIIVITVTSFSPDNFLKELLIVPGIHSITLVDHKYIVSVFILLWLLFIVYIYNISYVKSLTSVISSVFKNWRLMLRLGVPVLLGKFIIEFPLGLYVARKKYLSQTYLTQGSRYIPFVNFFNVIHKFLNGLYGNSPDLLVFWLPTIILVFWSLILFSRGLVVLKLDKLKSLLFMNIVMYLFIFPIIPGVRFIYPLILLVYLMGLYLLLTARISTKTLASYILVTLLILGLATGGMITWYPKNKLDFIWGVHTKELRDSLSAYLVHNGGFNGVYLSINPMDAYYLNLTVVPFTLDTFGIGYLSGLPPDFLLNYSLAHNVSYVLYDTWAYEIMKRSLKLRMAYSIIKNYSFTHGGVIFSKSFSDGERMDLLSLKNALVNNPVKISTDYGKFILFVNNSEVGTFWHGIGNSTSCGCSAELLWDSARLRYTLIQSCNGYRIESIVNSINSGIYIQPITPNATFLFNFSSPIVSKNLTLLFNTHNYSVVYILITKNILLRVSSNTIEVLTEEHTLKTKGPVRIQLVNLRTH
ncbi:ArnT family glycosyltransferase [Thermococcus prieurii]